MKYLIILLGYLSCSQAFFFNFWRRPSADITKESIPTASNEYYSPEERSLYNQIYSTNGFGYYPQINYPSVYNQLPVQRVSPIVTFLNSPGINILGAKQPIVVPEIPTFAEELKIEESPLHSKTEYAIPVVQHEELPLLDYRLPEYPSTKFHLTPQLEGIPEGVPGQYSHSYILSDGTKVFEEGHLKKSTTGNEVVVKSGHYEYINHNGELHAVNWIADENGFRVLE